jgi:hypothetical protein
MHERYTMLWASISCAKGQKDTKTAKNPITLLLIAKFLVQPIQSHPILRTCWTQQPSATLSCLKLQGRSTIVWDPPPLAQCCGVSTWSSEQSNPASRTETGYYPGILMTSQEAASQNGKVHAQATLQMVISYYWWEPITRVQTGKQRGSGITDNSPCYTSDKQQTGWWKSVKKITSQMTSVLPRFTDLQQIQCFSWS